MALDRQLPGRLKHQVSELADTNSLRLSQPNILFEDGHQVGGRLAASRHCVR